jgi:O-antigen/teichoic acid export membrane protein
MGISNVNVTFVAEYIARRQFDRANRLLSTGLLIVLPICTAVFGGVWLLWPRLVDMLKISPVLRDDAKVVVLAVVAIFLASSSLSTFRDALAGAQRGVAIQISWIAGYLLECVLIFTLVGMGHGIRGLAEAFLIRTALEIALSAWLAFRELPWLKISPSLYSREAVSVLWSYGGVVQLTSLMAVALNSIERAIAVPLAGLQAAGLLDIGQKLPSMASSVPSAFATAFTPAASYLRGGLDGTPAERETLHKLFLKGARYMNLTTGYLCGFMAAIAQPLLDVWVGKRFDGAAYLMTVFSVTWQIHLMTGPGTSLLKGIGKPQGEFHYAIPNAIAAAIFIPLSRVVLGEWTAVGIGTAVAAATIVSAIYFLWYSTRVLGVDGRLYFRRVALPGAVPYLAGALFTVPAYALISPAERWSSAAIVVVMGLMYTALMVWIADRKILDEGERLWFRSLASNAMAKIHARSR